MKTFPAILLPLLFVSFQDSDPIRFQASLSGDKRSFQVKGSAQLPDGAILQARLVRRIAGLYENDGEDLLDTLQCRVEKSNFSVSLPLKSPARVTDVWRIHIVFDPAQQPEAVRKSLPKSSRSLDQAEDVRTGTWKEMARDVEQEARRVDAVLGQMGALWSEVGKNSNLVREKAKDLESLGKQAAVLAKESILPFTARHLKDSLRYAQMLGESVEGERPPKTSDGREITVETVGYFLWETYQRLIHETLWLKLAYLQEHYRGLGLAVGVEVKSYDSKRWAKAVAEWEQGIEDLKAIGAFVQESKVYRDDWTKHLKDKIEVDGKAVELNYEELLVQLRRYKNDLGYLFEKKENPRQSKELHTLREEIDRHFRYYLEYLRMTRGKHH